MQRQNDIFIVLLTYTQNINKLLSLNLTFIEAALTNYEEYFAVALN